MARKELPPAPGLAGVLGSDGGGGGGHFASGRAIFTETVLAGLDDRGQPGGFEYEPSPSSTSDLCNWKKNMSSYRDDPEKMGTPFISVLTNYHHHN